MLVGSSSNESQELLENGLLWYHQPRTILVMATVGSRAGTGLCECLQQKQGFREGLSWLRVRRSALLPVCDM